MKLQNLTVIFIIIVLPIILLVSLYINTGLKTIRYQALYDTGLLTATQDAIQAFESNTVNNKYSNNPEEKRSIIKSSIKMFETSLCNTCNISAYDLEEIESYIPAIVFGMYDGFYLYSPSLNQDGEYEHSLKNYVYYSEILDQDNAVVIRYSLDSYVQVSGYFSGTYESKEGFLINADKVEFQNSSGTKISAEEFYKEYQKVINDDSIWTMPSGKIIYYGTEIDIRDEWAVNYFVDNYEFSNWFLNTANIDTYNSTDLDITKEGNDPEDPNSNFVKHKNTIIRNKIEGVLNSTITAYSKRTFGQNYKMPKLKEEEWERIYSDISVTTFFQGKRIGFTKYNGYCVLNSNNHYELVNPNLLYFTEDHGGETTGTHTSDGEINSSYDYYHDIRCHNLPATDSTEASSLSSTELVNILIKILTGQELTPEEENAFSGSGYVLIEEAPEGRTISTLRGWKVGRFKKVKLNSGIETGRGGTGPELGYKYNEKYMYERAECACYECINGSVNSDKTVYEYINVATDDPSTWEDIGHATEYLTKSYWTSLARERARLHEQEVEPDLKVTKKVAETSVVNGGVAHYTVTVTNNAPKTERVTITDGVYHDVDVPEEDKIEIASIIKCETNMGISYIGYGNSEGLAVDLRQGEILTVEYEARITDKSDADTSVTNQVIATVIYEGAVYTEPEWAKEATCNTIESDLTIIKTVNGEYAKTVEWGKETVKYKITVTNNTSEKDKINIRDVFYEKQITDVKNITVTRDKGTEPIGIGDKVSGIIKLDDGITEIGDTSRNWSNIDINPGETITITYDATLKGDIGVDVTNTAMVQSVLTGETKWDTASVTCKTKKIVDVQKLKNITNKEILLVLDTSWSEGFEMISGQYLETVNKFMKDIVIEGIGQVTRVVAFGGVTYEISVEKDNYEIVDGIKYKYNSIKPFSLVPTPGTRYDLAWDKVYNMIIEKKTMDPDAVIFFSDGAPTYGEGVFPVKPGELNDYGYWTSSAIKIGIDEQLNRIAEKGIDIFAATYGEAVGSFSDAIDRIPRNNGVSVQEAKNFEEMFDILKDNLSSDISVPDTYTTYVLGKVKLEHIDRITDIQIDSVSLSNFKSYIDGDILDLNKIPGFSGEKDITIVYE